MKDLGVFYNRNLKKLLTLFVLVGLISCNQKPVLKEVQVMFAPSFLHPTKFTIDIKNKTIEQYTFQDRYYVKEWLDSVSYAQHKKDTLIVHYQKSFSIDNEFLDRFLVQLRESKLDSTIVNEALILDGIGFQISKINTSNDTISLTSNLSSRNEKSQMEYKILDPFFELAYNSIDDYDGASIVENIQDYFSYGLPMRKVQEEPLEYRVWGSITGCREDNEELLKLLQNIPINEPVIFDLRNGSIAPCLVEVFEEYSQKREIYIYGDKSAFNAKKTMDEIKLAEKNGEILSELRVQAYEMHKTIYENWKNNQKIKSFMTKEEIIKTISHR